MIHEYFALGNYLWQQRSRDFAWGVNDCNTFVVDWIDRITGHDRRSEIAGQYSDAGSALRFQRRYTPAPEYLASEGFQRVEDLPRTGDVVLVPKQGFWAAHLIYNGLAWSTGPETNLVAGAIDSLEQPREVWRRQPCHQQ